MLEAFLIVTPFEVIKTRLQQQEGFQNRKYKNTAHAGITTNSFHSTVALVFDLDSLLYDHVPAVTILREEGMRALWKGVLPTALRNGSNQACNFMVQPQRALGWKGEND